VASGEELIRVPMFPLMAGLVRVDGTVAISGAPTCPT